MKVHLKKDEKVSYCGEKLEVLRIKDDRLIGNVNVFVKMRSMEKCKKCLEKVQHFK